MTEIKVDVTIGQMDEQIEKQNKLAADVLRLSRNTLLVNLRFLDAALHQLTPYPMVGVTLATEGNYLLYDPTHILRCYNSAKEIPVRDYLYVIFRCVFRRMYVHTLVDREGWGPGLRHRGGVHHHGAGA